jgi:hypothetical protein
MCSALIRISLVLVDKMAVYKGLDLLGVFKLIDIELQYPWVHQELTKSQIQIKNSQKVFQLNLKCLKNKYQLKELHNRKSISPKLFRSKYRKLLNLSHKNKSLYQNNKSNQTKIYTEATNYSISLLYKTKKTITKLT